MSRWHADHQYVLKVGGQEYQVGYLAAESDTGMFGGNSNWAGPVWFPINVMLTRAFLPGAEARRPVHGGQPVLQPDPHWRDLLLFYEYLHGDNGAGIGACHQTGWTGTAGLLPLLFRDLDPGRMLARGRGSSGPAARRQRAATAPAEEFWPAVLAELRRRHPEVMLVAEALLGYGVEASAAGLRLLLGQAALRPPH